MGNSLLYRFEDRYTDLLARDNTDARDVERNALFWILASNLDLYAKVSHIYDFEDRSIKPQCLDSDDVDFCSSSQKLIKLAFNLFNGFPADILETFYVLDDDNFKLAMTAIRIRFNKGDF